MRPGIDLCARLDDRARVDARRLRRVAARRPPLRQAGEVQVRVGGGDRRRAGADLLAQRRADDHAGRGGGRQQRRIARLGDEGQRDGVGLGERADALDTAGSVAGQLATERRDDLAERGAGRHRPALSASITRRVMSTRGPAKTTSCRIRS